MAVILVSTVSAEPPSVATPAKSSVTRPGFQVELLRSAGPDEGSWISMSFDNQDRLVIGRDKLGIARITLGSGTEQLRYELINDSLKHCRGVLYAHDSLYACATNGDGFYRLRDTTGDDRFDEVKLLKALDYRSRFGHGANQVVLGPDKMIYLVIGNDVTLPEGTDLESPYRDPQNDHLLPNPHDAGHDNRVGRIIRVSPDGSSWDVVAGGFRNQVDMAFNADGEMFTYDADMEWDVGQPWYRPTRLNHVVSAGEYGWRWGTGKWPVYYEDSLPSTLDTGLGSPTGMVFGYRASFPARERKALFMADWQNGRILMVDLEADGASYRCQYEVFLEGGALNICDMAIGRDGMLYFITGGRGSQSGLYRVSHDGRTGETPRQTAGQQRAESTARRSRELRHRLEDYHRRQDPTAITESWPALKSHDRWIRYAARLAIENQPVKSWRHLALGETDSMASSVALLALARKGKTADQEELLQALMKHDLPALHPTELLAWLRAAQLSCIRMGRPADNDTLLSIRSQLEALYPHSHAPANHLLCELLIYFNSPSVVGQTIPLLQEGSTRPQQVRFARLLTHARQGWDAESRLAMIDWLQRARGFQGGKLFPDMIGHIKQDFLDGLTDPQKQPLGDALARLNLPLENIPPPPERPLVKDWNLNDLRPAVSTIASGRSHQGGRQALLAASCLRCHRVGNEGGQVGPDLTGVGRRFTPLAILESIVEPSRVIDPKYSYTAYQLDDGRIVVGRAAHVSQEEIVLEVDPQTRKTV
ncbi:MAG: hypothetical protein QGH11_01480, partial [Pirellulaceae bacterium]|nr:hypothetical protein [Pirellulaceae bacterium]